MRGWASEHGALFSYVSCKGVTRAHPLRAIHEIVNGALAPLSPEFEKLYPRLGRPSIAPEKLLRPLLLRGFYPVRSERQLVQASISVPSTEKCSLDKNGHTARHPGYAISGRRRPAASAVDYSLYAI